MVHAGALCNFDINIEELGKIGDNLPKDVSQLRASAMAYSQAHPEGVRPRHLLKGHEEFLTFKHWLWSTASRVHVW